MKVGVIGLGSIGLRHARNLCNMGHDVIAFDPDGAKMAAFQLGLTPTREEVFIRSDAVVSASPSAEHINDLRTAIEYGVPILIEKPLATSITDELRALLADATHDEQAVMVGYNLRFHGCVIKAKEWLDKGLIGRPLWASFTCAQFNDKPAYRRDGVILNWSHEIDLALYLLGPATIACAAARTINGRDDIADIVLLHDNDRRSTVHLDYVSRLEYRNTRIVGRKGTIDIRLSPFRLAVLYTDNDAITVIPSDAWDDNYRAEMKAFLRRAEGKPAFGATGADGLAALEICMQARQLAGLT